MNYFTIDEFNCKCCGQNKMEEGFLERLDTARGVANIPFGINSGYRCPTHNAAIGSKSENHPSGRAADIRCLSGWERIRIIRALLQTGFNRIGVHPQFIHVDNMDELGAPPSCWFY